MSPYLVPEEEGQIMKKHIFISSYESVLDFQK